jgi:hypothetical protein
MLSKERKEHLESHSQEKGTSNQKNLYTLKTALKELMTSVPSAEKPSLRRERFAFNHLTLKGQSVRREKLKNIPTRKEEEKRSIYWRLELGFL